VSKMTHAVTNDPRVMKSWYEQRVVSLPLPFGKCESIKDDLIELNPTFAGVTELLRILDENMSMNVATMDIILYAMRHTITDLLPLYILNSRKNKDVTDILHVILGDCSKEKTKTWSANKRSYANGGVCDGLTMLSGACIHNNIHMVRALLTYTPIDINGALSTACSHDGGSSIIKILLEDSRIDANEIMIPFLSGRMCTVLAYAIDYGYTQNVIELLKHDDIDVNRQDVTGFSMLQMACLHNHVDIAKALLMKKNLDINLNNGQEALNIAVLQCSNHGPTMVQTLLTREDINVTLSCELAQSLGNVEITKLLQRQNIRMCIRRQLAFFTRSYMNALFCHFINTCKQIWKGIYTNVYKQTKSVNNKNGFGCFKA
jgi:ankyrin repeat protein